jgi:carbonic anhydrase
MFLAVAIMASACAKPSENAKQKTEAPPAEAPPAEAPAAAHEAPHWDYGQKGPAAWGTLSPEFVACAEGTSQSPIDLTTVTEVPALMMKLSFQPAALRIVHHAHMSDVVNTGHSIQVNASGNDTLSIGGEAFTLLQYHFHSPSEHTVDGKHFPMEMHLVHRSADKKLAVVGALIQEGKHNAAFDPVWANLPKEKGVEAHLENTTVNVDDLLPEDLSAYYYDGSLTTPPCSEGVKWFVLTTPIQLSAEQIAAFRAVVHDNNRPVQPLNQRTVVRGKVTEEAAG